MKFEKITENKIRIILSAQDLEKDNIDCRTVLSDSTKARNLFLKALSKAEDEIGFKTENYDLRFEAFASESGNFIVIVTRQKSSSIYCNEKKKSKVKVKKKILMNSSSIYFIYKFNNFDDICNYISFVSNDISSIAEEISLYSFDNNYYLVFKNISIAHNFIKNFHPTLVEFSTYINNSDIFSSKLFECGTNIMKHNAINTISKYFLKKENKKKVSE